MKFNLSLGKEEVWVYGFTHSTKLEGKDKRME